MGKRAELSAHDVFTPSSFPEHTYVARRDADLEEQLRFALLTKGQIVSLSGPSKSGKTVLVEKVVGKDNLIPIVGAGIRDAEQVWTRVLDWLDTPIERSAGRANTIQASARVGGRAGGDIVVAAAQATGHLQTGVKREGTEIERKARRGLEQVIDEIGGSEYVLLVDDFHYMPREVQAEVAKQLKEAARRDVRIVTAAVPHRADDVVRANPELRGRVASVDVPYWKVADLVRIASAGFDALNVDLDEASADRLAREAAGSPQLMQALCLYTCFVLETTTRFDTRVVRGASSANHVKACKLTSTVCDFRSLVDVLDAGPGRGAERKTYRFADGDSGDVYRAVLKAIATEPLALSFRYEDILARVATIAADDVPPGSSIATSLAHMDRLALDQLPTTRVLEWDEGKQVLDIPDPYFMFYLRWSSRLSDRDAS